MSKLIIKHSSSVDMKVDAIVNAANKYLASGSGVCGEIFKRAGYIELNNACRSIKTPLKDGSAVITPSFNINTCKYIIHAVGPDFNINPDAFDSLYLAYYNSLLLIKDNNLRSVSFPLISAGIYGGGIDNIDVLSCKELIKAYENFNKTFNYDITVYLCAYSEKEYNDIKKYDILN